MRERDSFVGAFLKVLYLGRTRGSLEGRKEKLPLIEGEVRRSRNAQRWGVM